MSCKIEVFISKHKHQDKRKRQKKGKRVHENSKAFRARIKDKQTHGVVNMFKTRKGPRKPLKPFPDTFTPRWRRHEYEKNMEKQKEKENIRMRHSDILTQFNNLKYTI